MHDGEGRRKRSACHQQSCTGATSCTSTGPKHRVLVCASRAIPSCAAAPSEAKATRRLCRRHRHGRSASAVGPGAIERPALRQAPTDAAALPVPPVGAVQRVLSRPPSNRRPTRLTEASPKGGGRRSSVKFPVTLQVKDLPMPRGKHSMPMWLLRGPPTSSWRKGMKQLRWHVCPKGWGSTRAAPTTPSAARRSCSSRS